MFLTGIALLTPLGLAGAAVYVAGHALVKAALFLCVGIVLHRLGSVNETWLHGRGRPLRVTGVVFTIAALGLADLPPFATFLGKGWIEAAAASHGMAWIRAVFIVCSALVGGAVLRVAGGVFYGLGDPPGEDPQMAEEASEETGETDQARQRTPLSMIVPAIALVVAGLVIGAAARHRPGRPGGSRAVSGPGRLQRHRPVRCARGPSRGLFPPEPTGITAADLVTGLGLGSRGAPPRLPRTLLAAPAAAAPRLRAGRRPGTGPSGASRAA